MLCMDQGPPPSQEYGTCHIANDQAHDVILAFQIFPRQSTHEAETFQGPLVPIKVLEQFMEYGNGRDCAGHLEKKNRKHHKHGGHQKKSIRLVLSTWHPLDSVTRWLEVYID